MFYQLPPAGNPVSLSSRPNIPLPSILSGSSTLFYASGTAALAAAIVAAMASKVAALNTANKLVDEKQAEVILPAYSCPDLVSAVVFAGAKPVLVDMEKDRPWLSLTQLAAAINDNTVAIIAVNLFGMPERWPLLRELADKNQVVLIEDSAQYFPGTLYDIENQQEASPENWHGDMVVFSFGRGKPVSLLGGGAVLVRDAGFYTLLPGVKQAIACVRQRIVFAIKAKLYNAMISPYLYWLPQSLPFLHLGETRYHPLPVIEAMDAERKHLLPANVLRYVSDEKAARSSGQISAMLASVEAVIDLPQVCGVPTGRRLLRYPILVDAAVRDVIYQKLKQAGLGASVMYPASLPAIEGLSAMFAGQSFVQAETFASKLITLPAHAGVSLTDIEKMATILATVPSAELVAE